jgi:LruC domain-containing protein
MYNEGIINVTGTYHTDDRCQTVNANMLTANIVTVDEDAQLLNKGTMTVTGELGVKNTNSLFINEGTATAGSVGVEGSADFYNDGTMTVKGTTTVNSNSCTWHNDGTYNTNKYIYQAGSTDVINNCKLYVEDTFYLGLGDTDQNRFKLNAGGSVVTKYFEFSGPGFLDMGSGSLFKVTESAYMAITKDVYGIYGPATGDYAVFQAKQIMRRSDVDANQGFVANYFNHLYVATDSHFNFGYSDLSDEQEAAGQVGGQPYYRLDAASGATMTTYNGADVHLLDNGCGAVYDGEPEEHEPVAQEFSLRYCFEDNFPDWGDYDFNDVVLTVTPTIQGAAVKLKVSIDAVGATKSIGAAIRIVGVKPEDIVSFERIGNFDSNFPETGKIIINEDGGDRYNTDCLLPASTKCAAISNDVVIKLFSNAHWAILPQLSPTGTIRNWFFNTVASDDASAGDVNMLNGVEPKVVIYNFVMKDEATANKFVKDNLDAFIVEPYGAGFMEVHTIPWKTIEVLHEYANGNKDDYSDNYPWAICLPGNDFRYPREWWAITKAYQKSGHSFRRWAKYHTKAQDWYLYPTEEALYK